MGSSVNRDGSNAGGASVPFPGPGPENVLFPVPLVDMLTVVDRYSKDRIDGCPVRGEKSN